MTLRLSCSDWIHAFNSMHWHGGFDCISNGTTLTTGVSVCLVILVMYHLKSPWRHLPPGPPGWPILGSILEIRDAAWLKFSAWRKDYGDIIYVSAAGQPMVVLNSRKAAIEILDRRASIYSDRPRKIVACDILCSGLLLPLLRYSETWRRARKAAHEAMNKVAAHNLNLYQFEEALVLVRNGLQNAAGWKTHIRRSSASMLLRCLYDQSPVSSEHDARLKQINDFTSRVTLATLPGAYWVNFLPWMRYILSVFAPWKRTAEEWNRKDGEAFRELYGDVQRDIDQGSERVSFSATLINKAGRYRLNTDESAWLVASVYAAGSDAIRSALSWWTLAMLLQPEVQERAQRELDTVVGRARVPTFADMPNLPYIQAIVKEVSRWRPVTPLGIPHQSTEDDFYEGYFIPKGTVVFANVWEMNHDPDVFGSDAHLFNPDRYLSADGELLPSPSGTKDDGHYTFASVSAGTLQTTASSSTSRPASGRALFVNPKGQELDADAYVDEGTIVVPEPFEVDVQPRFPDAFAVLSQECDLRGR